MSRGGWAQARTDAIAGTERAGQRDEAREQNPRQRTQRREGTCLRGGSLQHECGERRAEGAFDRTRIVLKQGAEGAEGVEDTEGADRGCLGLCGGALTSKRLRYSPLLPLSLMSVLCSGGSLGSKPASFLILAMASFSDLASTSTTRSEINSQEGSMRIIV